MTPNLSKNYPGSLVCLGLLLFGLLFNARACAESLEKWRSEITDTRALAENDAPGAYLAAQRLKAALPVDATGADKARIINLLSRVELYLGLTAKSAQHAAEARVIAQQNNDREGLIKADINTSLAAINQGRLDDMVESTRESMDLLADSGREDMRAEVMFLAAMMYLRFGQLDEAATTAMQSLEISKNSPSMLARIYAIQGVAAVYDQSGRRAEALEYYQYMLEIARQAHSSLMQANAMTGMAGMFAEQGEFESSESQFLQAIEIYRRVGVPLYVAHATFQLADRYFRNNKPALALPLLDEDVALYEQYDNPIGLWWTLNESSSVLQALGKLGPARSDALRGNGLAKKIGYTIYLAGSARRLAEIAAAQGDFQQAYHLSAQADELNGKVEREKTGKRILELAQRFQQESKQRQINELTRLNLEQSARQRWLLTILAGSIGLLFISGFFLLRLRRSRAEIRALNADLEKRVQERTAELETSHNFLDSVIESVSDPIFVKDKQHRWMLLNDAFCAFIGHPRENLLGKSDHDFFPKEQADVFWAKDELVFDSGKVNLNEEVLTTASGKEHYIQTKKTPFISSDGRPMLVGVIRDITDYRLYGEAREAALAEAKRLAQLRSEFLAQMSHELRTALNCILGFAQIMARDTKLSERQIAGVLVIQQSGEHLLTLINDILDFSKIDSGKMELYPGDIQLDRFIQTIAGIIRVKADQKRLEFTCSFAPDLPAWISADEKRLRQILLNLLSNAVKFTDRGRVGLRVDSVRPGCLRFEVSDTGIGIAADQQETIFRAFEQISEKHNPFGGTGLGLPISRRIARLMNSDIHVESKPGTGSVFGFELEVAVKNADTLAALPERVVTGYKGSRKTILVVDDVQANRDIVIEMLSRLGFSVIHAQDGSEGLEKAQSHHPDLILMDTIMPQLDGLEAIRRLRRLDGCESIPVITISASASAEDEANSHAAGANAFIPKPLEMMRLLAQIGRLLKLEWEYGVDEADESLVAPPAEEMGKLHQAALAGNMREILQYSEYLTGKDECYRPFADRLRGMALEFKSKDILSFIEHHLERNSEA